MKINQPLAIPAGVVVTVCKPSRRKAVARFDKMYRGRMNGLTPYKTAKVPDEQKPLVRILNRK